MKERPILFSAPMVRAILAGVKTQTRRVVKPHPTGIDGFPDAKVSEAWRAGFIDVECPYGVPGDHLWVRETWCKYDRFGSESSTELPDSSLSPALWGYWRKQIAYRADGEPDVVNPRTWKPSIFMFRWASRIALEVVDLRVQRLQGISEADAVAEGINVYGVTPVEILTAMIAGMGPIARHAFLKTSIAIALSLADVMMGKRTLTNRDAYAILWDRINGKRKGCAWSDNPWVWAVSFRRVDAK
jgi:hypothetical protein